MTPFPARTPLITITPNRRHVLTCRIHFPPARPQDKKPTHLMRTCPRVCPPKYGIVCASHITVMGSFNYPHPMARTACQLIPFYVKPKLRQQGHICTGTTYTPPSGHTTHTFNQHQRTHARPGRSDRDGRTEHVRRQKRTCNPLTPSPL